MYDDTGEVPDEPYVIPLGKANVLRKGSDVTIVAIGRMVQFSIQAADALAKENIKSTVIDPRTTSPLDIATIFDSVAGTGRLVIVDEASPRCNIATDISALVAQSGFRSLKAPIKMVTPPHTPVPFAGELEDLYVPSPAKIQAAVVEVVRYH